MNVFRGYFSRVIWPTTVPMVSITNNDPSIIPRLLFSKSNPPCSVLQRGHACDSLSQLYTVKQSKVLSIGIKIIEHVLAAGEIGKTCGHGIVGKFSCTARRDDVRCFVHSMGAVAANAVRCVSLFTANPLAFDGFGNT